MSEGLVEKPSYKPFPLAAPPSNLVKTRPKNMGVANTAAALHLARAAGTVAGVFQMNLFNDGPKAEAITVVLVEDDAPTLQRDDVSESSRSKIQSRSA